MKIKPVESQTIDFLRLLFCIAIVFLHAYTSTMQVVSLSENKPFYESITYIFAFQWGELGVPAFFLVAGYLFFRNTSLDFTDYKRKIGSRFHSLVIPYLFWNFLFIVLFFIAEQIPTLSQFFTGANKRISDYSWLDFIRAFWDRGDWNGGNGTPFDWPLWFMRNLFCLCLISPVLKAFISYCKFPGIILLFVVWYLSPGLGFLFSSILFFSLGGYISIEKKDLIVPDKKFLYGLLIIYPILFILDFFMRGLPYHLTIHRTALVVGIFFFFYLTAWCVEKGWVKSRAYYGQLSVFIYVIHNPILNIIRKATVKLFPMASDELSVLLYFANVFVMVGFSVLLFWFLRKYVPVFLRYTVGR